MRILLDECVPRTLKRLLPGHYVRTAQQAGFTGYKNGQLLDAAEAEYDLFITSDQNLQYQQNLEGRALAILMLSTNDRTTLTVNADQILRAVNGMHAGEFETLSF